MKDEQIRVFDIMRRMMAVAEMHSHASQQNETTTLDILHLPAGIHFRQIQTKTGTVAKKGIKAGVRN